MPTYEYQCEACGYHFELMQPITQKPKKLCPQCKKKTLKRLIGTGSGIIFKGTGFYETDYKNKKPQKEENNKQNKNENTKKPQKK
jgi:putative FmdB family regulatory protein